MSDTDSNVGYNRDMNRDMNMNRDINMNRDMNMSREREREDQSAHRSRIDDQLEARIFSAENTTESSDTRPLNSAKSTPSQPYVTTPAVAANYGPYGGPSFGPFEGPVFGFNAAPDRWSELGSGTPTPGPSVGTPRGAEYSTPMGLQFYSPFWSQLQYQADDVFARSYMVTKLQVESDRWSGRWHNVGSPGAGAVPCNNSACPSMGHTIEVMNMPSEKSEEGNAGLTGVTGVTGFGLSLIHPHDCSFRAHECHDMLSPDMVIHNNNQHQLQPQLQRDDSTMHASVLSSTGASTDIGGKNDDVIIDVIVIYPNENTSADTQASHDESESDSTNNGLVTVGKTYAEAVINKKELIKEIEEERRRQEVNLFCLISTRAPQDTTDTSESNVNMTEDERKNSGSIGMSNVNLYYGSENSVSDGKTLVQSVGTNPSKIICIMEKNNASVVDSVSEKSSNEVERSRGEVVNDSVLEGHTDDEFKDETDEQDRQERRKNLKSYSVSLTTLNLASPGKALTQAPPPKPNTILNKISTIINHDNTNNINPVNTLFSVLSLTTSSSHSYSLHPPNSSAPSNSTSTFGNESSSFNSTYTNSKLLSDNNKNYYFNNIHNNYKPVNNTTGSFTSNKTQSNSSGNLQKLNNTHNPKSVKRHGSLNSISNYGGTNFPGSNSPLKQKMKNSVARGGVRECVSRGAEGRPNPAEDTLLQSDELHTQYSAKIRTFVEVCTCTYLL
jgi:hypothetical protein